MKRNGEAIHGTRPYEVYGEGPTTVTGAAFNEGKVEFAEGDVRYTVKGDTIYAAFLVWPTHSVVLNAIGPDFLVGRVTLLGGGPVPEARDGHAITLFLPPPGKDDFIPVVTIERANLHG